MNDHADCVIIGGGITGCFIAYYLTQFDCCNVVLLEKDFLASKATGICPGGIRQQWSNEAACLYARESVHFFENLDAELHPDFPLPFVQTGYMFLAYSDEILKSYRSNVALQNQLGIPSKILNAEDALKLVPGLQIEELRGASFCGTDGFVENAHGLIQLLVERAKQRGAKFRFEAALSIETKNDLVTGVRTPSGVIKTAAVVNAAGIDSLDLAKGVGIDLPIKVERRRLIFTECIAERVLEPLVATMEKGWAGKQLTEGVIYMGYLKETAESLDDRVYIEKTIEAALEVIPSLAEVGVAKVAEGFYDTSPDGHPLLGYVPGFQGYFQAAGFSGHGYMIAPAVGRVMAELILGYEPSFPLEPFSLSRFQKQQNRDHLMI